MPVIVNFLMSVDYITNRSEGYIQFLFLKEEE